MRLSGQLGVAVIATVLVPAGALAQRSDTERARAHYMTATSYYDQGRYEEAATEFREAYRLSARVHLLRNVSRCLELAGEHNAAADALAELLDKSPDVEDRRTVLTKIEALRSREQRGAGAHPSRDSDLSDGTSPVPSVETEVAQEPEGGPLKSRSEPADRPPSLNLLPWALLIGGAASLAAAGVTGAFALSASSDLETQCGPDRVCPANLQDDADAGRTLATVADILLTTGVIGVGTGGLWLLLSQGEGETDRSGLALRATCHLRGCSTEARWIF